jgi:TusA-related sulfurtransferase
MMMSVLMVLDLMMLVIPAPILMALKEMENLNRVNQILVILDKDESDQLGLTGFAIFAAHTYDLNNDEHNWTALSA